MPFPVKSVQVFLILQGTKPCNKMVLLIIIFKVHSALYYKFRSGYSNRVKTLNPTRSIESPIPIKDFI